MTHQLKLKKNIEKDLLNIGQPAALRIFASIEKTLLASPSTAGKKLKGGLHDLWSFRVGHYRVLYKFNSEEMWVLVVRISHRKDVYRD